MPSNSLDERFHTPRASAFSSRSNNSASSSVYGTPRTQMLTARSQSSTFSNDSNDLYCTPRSSPYPPACGRRNGGHRDVGHDRSSDLRRFADRSSLSGRAPMMGYSCDRDSSLSRRPEAVQQDYNGIWGSDSDRDSSLSRRPHSVGYNNGISSIQPPSAQMQQDYNVRTESKAGTEPNIKIISLARHGRVGEVEEMLLRGIPIDTVDDNGNTILHVGCQNGSKRIARLAIKYGADINKVNYAGNTPLYFAMKYGFGQTLGQWLISKGAHQP